MLQQIFSGNLDFLDFLEILNIHIETKVIKKTYITYIHKLHIYKYTNNFNIEYFFV